jgi:hypothetical protein
VEPACRGDAIADGADSVDPFIVLRTIDAGNELDRDLLVGHPLADQDEIIDVAGGDDPVGLGGANLRHAAA